MVLKYFSLLPSELKEKIVREHLKEERKREFLENSVLAACRRYEDLLLKDDITDEELLHLSKFLDSLVQYVTDYIGSRCLIRWKKDVSPRVKYSVMEEQHIQLYGFRDMEDLSCEELLLPEVEEDITYEDGMIVNCGQLDALFRDLGVTVVYITIGNGLILLPMCKEIVIT
ncbi:cell cycle link protein [Cow vetch latent virus]|uniref:Cell cycle link protein n=1 Tax=Cow vetch latent virus TaxID=2056780 RepID=A0A2H4T2E8_9VIRU|nr:cell cycle link protein [Cow vetch latent virus]ATY70079.1 cell cycle link protein [Cow vetch latent virus]